MTAADWMALLPFLVLAASTLAVTLLISFHRSHAGALALTLVGLALAFATLWIVSTVTPRQVTSLITVDGLAVFYLGLILAAGLGVALLLRAYAGRRSGMSEEIYLLLLLATLGACVLTVSSHFATLFLGLELLSVALYVMIAYLRTSAIALEAGIKYLILAAASSAFLLFGMALIYAGTGTMDLIRLAAMPAGTTTSPFVLVGSALILTGLGFKLAVVPFHMWTPDVYEGAAAPVTAFLATVSKGAVVATLLRYSLHTGMIGMPGLEAGLGVIAALSMIGGNVLALLQTRVKRILAYSSIAHLGYVLVAFVASGSLAVEAVTFYLATYFVTTLGAFGVVALLSGESGDADALGDYRGLAWHRPWLAAFFTTTLLSLAGIPLTAGFIGKFFVVAAGAQSGLWWLVIILALTSALGLYYYLRITVVLFASPEERPANETPPRVAPSLAGGIVLGVLAALLLWIGVYPGPLEHMIRASVVTTIPVDKTVHRMHPESVLTIDMPAGN
jgi:NADH-quinone oxidoreductase subunit N